MGRGVGEGDTWGEVERELEGVVGGGGCGGSRGDGVGVGEGE